MPYFQTSSCRRILDIVISCTQCHQWYKTWYFIEDQHKLWMARDRCPHYWPTVRGIHQSSVGASPKHSALNKMDFLLLLASISCWTNSWVATPLMRHDAHWETFWKEEMNIFAHLAIAIVIVIICYLEILSLIRKWRGFPHVQGLKI